MQGEKLLQEAKWISPNDPSCQSPIIMKKFCLESFQSGVLYVTGLGYFEVLLNGQKVTEDLLVPVASDYEFRSTYDTFYYPVHDQFTYRIYYCRYDVSDLLICGENTLQIQLGNGWYRQTERTAEGDSSYGSQLKTIFALDIDGEKQITSNGDEVWYPSEIVENQLFIGEVHDARILESSPTANPVVILPHPNSTMSLQTAPADRVIRTIVPKCVYADEHRSVWDVGENISGVVRVTGNGSAGEEIHLRFAEQIRDNALDFDSTGASYTCRSGKKQIMEDTFICGNSSKTFTPKFVWHAFRYFEMTGPGVDPRVLVIHSDMPVTSSFDSDNEGWNFLYDAFVRTQLANSHGSIPSDCPHRERLGYTGDGQAASLAAMLLLGSEKFYQKWIQDILDGQDPTSGHVQHTAPFMGGGGGPGGWGCAVVIVPYNHYQTFGDVGILEKCYPAMRKWIAYMLARTENGLLVREEDGGWCLGDWCTPEKIELPAPFVNTCYFIHSLDLMMNIATVLKRPDSERAEYLQWMEVLRQGIKSAYYDPQTDTYCGNNQGAHAYAAWVGLADDKMLWTMVGEYRQEKRFDTGFLGTAILCEVLFSEGYADVVNDIMSNDSVGTFLYMKRNGATTLWEHWDGRYCSHNHPMFGGCASGIVHYLLGLRPADALSSYNNLLVSPVTPSGMNWARGSIVTAWGEIATSWERSADGIIFRISVPENITAVFRYGSHKQKLHAGLQEITVPC